MDTSTTGSSTGTTNTSTGQPAQDIDVAQAVSTAPAPAAPAAPAPRRPKRRRGRPPADAPPDPSGPTRKQTWRDSYARAKRAGTVVEQHRHRVDYSTWLLGCLALRELQRLAALPDTSDLTADLAKMASAVRAVKQAGAPGEADAGTPRLPIGAAAKANVGWQKGSDRKPGRRSTGLASHAHDRHNRLPDPAALFDDPPAHAPGVSQAPETADNETV